MNTSLPNIHGLDDEAVYESLKDFLHGLLDASFPAVTNLANFSSALASSFGKISWAGFYLYDGQKLFLGPFQGKPACTVIEIGRGVCGAAARDLRTVIVPDVHQFPGHIACDSESKSEIVVPMVRNGELLGVLDLDSYEYNAFGETDKKQLEDLVSFLVQSILP